MMNTNKSISSGISVRLYNSNGKRVINAMLSYTEDIADCWISYNLGTDRIEEFTSVSFSVEPGEGDYEIMPIFVESSENADIEPLKLNWQSTAGTIYGGYIDLTQGILVQEWIYKTLSDFSVSLSSNSETAWTNWQARNNNNPGLIDFSISSCPVVCDRFIATPQTGGLLTQNQSLPIVWMSAADGTLRFKSQEYCTLTAAEFKETFADMKVCYKLKNPIEYSLTPQTLKTLRGTNNIWSNSNGDITVQFWTH